MSRLNTILLMLNFCFASAAAEEKTGISFDSLTINIGTIYKDEPVKSFTIDFRNISKQNMVIDTVEVSCECTLVSYKKKKYKKGERGTLDVTLDMSPYSSGLFEKDIYVYTDSRKEPVELIITGLLKPKEEK